MSASSGTEPKREAFLSLLTSPLGPGKCCPHVSGTRPGKHSERNGRRQEQNPARTTTSGGLTHCASGFCFLSMWNPLSMCISVCVALLHISQCTMLCCLAVSCLSSRACLCASLAVCCISRFAGLLCMPAILPQTLDLAVRLSFWHHAVTTSFSPSRVVGAAARSSISMKSRATAAASSAPAAMAAKNCRPSSRSARFSSLPTSRLSLLCSCWARQRSSSEACKRTCYTTTQDVDISRRWTRSLGALDTSERVARPPHRTSSLHHGRATP